MQVVQRLGALLTNLQCVCLFNIYGMRERAIIPSRVLHWNYEVSNDEVSRLALAVYKELPKPLPWLEGLHMEIKLNI